MKIFILQVLLAVAIGGAQSRIFPFFSKSNERNFDVLPNHKNFSMMARFIVHNSIWAAVAYTSQEKDTLKLPLATIFSMVDGPVKNGTGVPYFYVTELDNPVKGLVQNDSRCALLMSLAQSDVCVKNKWDPYDPRCARVYLTGRFEKLNNKTAEYDFAKKSFEERHTLMPPSSHNFLYAKYNIESVKVISGFGGEKVVSLKDYFGVKDSK